MLFEFKFKFDSDSNQYLYSIEANIQYSKKYSRLFSYKRVVFKNIHEFYIQFGIRFVIDSYSVCLLISNSVIPANTVIFKFDIKSFKV